LIIPAKRKGNLSIPDKDINSEILFDRLGGEPLEGSGFETEIPESHSEWGGSPMNFRTPSTKRDLRQEITDNIIAALEKGVAPWQKPWQTGALEMPMNPTTGKSYRGGNALQLMVAGMRGGSEDPRWITYRQAHRASLMIAFLIPVLIDFPVPKGNWLYPRRNL